MAAQAFVLPDVLGRNTWKAASSSYPSITAFYMKTIKLLLTVAGGVVLGVVVLNAPFVFLGTHRPQAVLVRTSANGHQAHGADSLQLAMFPDSIFHRAPTH